MLKNKLLLIICLFLFIIPFFWLKPGEIDIGGDSSRLYFYDPIHYLQSYPLYAIGPDGVGNEMIGYSLIPFVFFLAMIKTFIDSPYLLITLFNSFSLVVAFLSLQRIVVELFLATKENKKNVYLASILTGIVYVFSPLVMNAGWDKAMYIHNQFFLNPLLFLLTLMFIKKDNIIYMFLALILSFIFSPNFSPSPYFFSFYFFAISFLYMYALWIKKYLPIKKIFIGGIIYIFLHFYYLFPFIFNMVSASSSVHATVFSDQGKFVRGLSAFLGDVGNVSLAHNLIGSTLKEPVMFSLLWILLFSIILAGMYFSFKEKNLQQKKIFLLLIAFFLLTLFFITAHITDTGLFIYKILFQIPGFSMFRHFYGQFIHVYIFFYSMLFGLSFYYLLLGKTVRITYTTFAIIFLSLIINALPFIQGTTIRSILNPGAKNLVSIPLQMDPNFEQVLTYIRNQPDDTKYMQFPLSDAGYEMFAGSNGGVYQGPSAIAYLSGKNEFVGYEGYGLIFRDLVVDLLQKKDFATLDKLYSSLNIQYLFYNSDPIIYDNFPHFPYDYVRQFLPKDQKRYQEFLQSMHLKKIRDFGPKYHLFELPFKTTHISVSSVPAFTNDTNKFLNILQLPIASASAVASINSYNGNGDVFLFGNASYPFELIKNNAHLHIHQPYVSRSLTSKGYPFSVFAERNDLQSKENNLSDFTDLSMFYATKRITELEQWGNSIPLIKKAWHIPSLWNIPFRNYNSWEASLTRYDALFNAVIKKSNATDTLMKEETAIKLHEQLDQHYVRLIRIIRSSTFSDADKHYLRNTVDTVFEDLYKKIIVPTPNTNTYAVSTTHAPLGPYNVFSYDNIKHIQNLGTFSLYQQHDVSYTTLDEASLPYDYPNQITIPALKSYNLSLPLMPGNQYSLMLIYKTEGNDITCSLKDKIKDVKGNVSDHTYFEKNLNDREATEKSIVFTTDKTSSKSMLAFTNETNEPVVLSLQNVTLKNAAMPTLFFYKKSQANVSTLPNIAYQKINPTKYKIFISNASTPFYLNFLEAFNSRWKIYQEKSYSTTQQIRSSFKTDQLQQKNIFLDRNIFETFGKQSLSENSHMTINNYANSWYLTPDMMGDKKEYVLILEFKTQQYFYVLFAISLITFLILSLFTIYQVRKKW